MELTVAKAVACFGPLDVKIHGERHGGSNERENPRDSSRRTSPRVVRGNLLNNREKNPIPITQPNTRNRWTIPQRNFRWRTGEIGERGKDGAITRRASPASRRATCFIAVPTWPTQISIVLPGAVPPALFSCAYESIPEYALIRCMPVKAGAQVRASARARIPRSLPYRVARGRVRRVSHP